MKYAELIAKANAGEIEIIRWLNLGYNHLEAIILVDGCKKCVRITDSITIL